MNFLSWVILFLVLGTFAFVVWRLCRNKKQGCGGCSRGACGNCPMKGTCKGQNRDS